MSTTSCPHGFAPEECLICRTLGAQPQVQVESGGRPRGRRGPGRPGAPAAGSVAKPDAVYPPEGRPARSLGGHLALIVVGVVAIGAVAWLVAGVVFALLHVLELLVVAGVAGWAGYRLGHFRGRRQHP